MPLRIRSRFSMTDLQDIQLAEPFAFTKGSRTMKIPALAWPDAHGFGTVLFDIDEYPGQADLLRHSEIEARMMKENYSPLEQFQSLGEEASI